MSKIVLITGCSTGIGRDLAQHLTQAGYTVVATARKVETLEDLSSALKLPLDVTQDYSVEATVARAIQEFGRIDVLVNNAGYAIRGALEEVPDEPIRQMFDVNVFGALRVIRAVAPHMRTQGSGRIINISSIAGKLSTPVNGAYSASKFALEALSDALRLELSPFGVQVVLVEPGAIKTNFDETSQTRTGGIISPNSPYRPLYQKSDEFAASMRGQEPGPEVVSRVIRQAIEAGKPKARYLAGLNLPGRLVMFLRDYAWEGVVGQVFKVESAQRKNQ